MRVLLVILAAVLAVVTLQLISAASSTPATWGMNHYGFLPAVWHMAGLGVLVVCALIALLLPAGLRELRVPGALLGVGLAVAGGILFWSFREQVHFLGEGTLLIRSFEEGIRLRKEAPGALGAVFALDRSFGTGSPGSTFAVLSAIAGVAYLLLALGYSRLVARDPAGAWFAFGLLGLAGLTRLFYGAADPNALTVAAVLLYLVLGIRALHRGSFPWPGALALAVVLPLHLSLLLLVPSLVALLWMSGPEGRPRRVAGVVLSLPFLLAGIGLAAWVWGDLGGWMTAVRAHFGDLVPLAGDPGLRAGSTLWSPVHLGDVFQQWFLAGPFGILLFLAIRLFGGRAPLGREGRFLLWAAIPWTLFALVHNPGIGAPAGWSQFAPATLPWLMLTGLLFARLPRDPADAGRTRLAVGLILGAGFFHLLPIVAVEARGEAGLSRFVALHGPGTHVSRMGRAAAFEEVSEYYKRNQDPQSAVVALTEAFQADTTSSRLAGNLGSLLTVMGRLDEALPVFEEGTRRDPENEVVQYQLAGAYEAAGRNEEALQALDRAIALNPDFLQSYLRASLLSRRLGDSGAAERYLLEAGRRFPDDGDVASNLGRVYEDLGRHDDAVAAYERGLALNPEDPAAAFNLARLYLAAERPAEAADVLRGVVALTPDDAEAWINLGAAYGAQEKYEESERAYEKARALAPARPEPYFNLARQKLLGGDRESALALLRSYVARDSTSDYGLMGRSLIRRLLAESPEGKKP